VKLLGLVVPFARMEFMCRRVKKVKKMVNGGLGVGGKGFGGLKNVQM